MEPPPQHHYCSLPSQGQLKANVSTDSGFFSAWSPGLESKPHADSQWGGTWTLFRTSSLIGFPWREKPLWLYFIKTPQGSVPQSCCHNKAGLGGEPCYMLTLPTACLDLNEDARGNEGNVKVCSAHFDEFQ